MSWWGQLLVFGLLIAGVFIPYQAVLVPLRQFWSVVDVGSLLAGVPVLGPRSDLIELTITHTAYGIPICTVLFRSYYQTIDDDMLEAPRLDGASVTRIYRRIVLPLSIPMFAATLIYQFTQVWNDLLFALVIVQSSEFFVVTQGLNALQGSLVQEYNIQMAGAFFAALPTLIVYVLFGKQFAEGVAGEGTLRRRDRRGAAQPPTRGRSGGRVAGVTVPAIDPPRSVPGRRRTSLHSTPEEWVERHDFADR